MIMNTTTPSPEVAGLAGPRMVASGISPLSVFIIFGGITSYIIIPPLDPIYLSMCFYQGLIKTSKEIIPSHYWKDLLKVRKLTKSN